MNGMTHSIFWANRLGRLRQWSWLCLLLTLLLARVSLGTDLGYTNDAFVEYFIDGIPADTIIIPSDFNPMIDAYNFVNNGTFIMANQSLYQTQNTTNYINTGLMESFRFWFDRHNSEVSPYDTWASGFYNPGQIYCEYTLQVSATNIVSPGTLTVGDSLLGKIELLGKNVDLSRSTISMPGDSQGNGSIFGFSPTVGAITNFWSPGVNLTLPNPYTPPFRVPPALFASSFQLFNAIAYANDTGVVNSNRTVQVVFISQPNPAIANNVSFDPARETGNITVQFSGTYIDPTTALPVINYLSIQDNFGERTNLQIFGGFPVNYTIYELQSIFGPPPPAGLPAGIFGNVSITNVFSYSQVQLASTTVSTNNIANGALTNLPGRIQITAGSDLDLTLASISGANYMSLTATNQFDGAPLQIISPFADIHLGVTNGFMTTTNLLAPFIPVWCGTVRLWSARWQLVDTNAGFTVTNYFHVLFVDAEPLVAAASAQVQDLILHATNSLVISDVFNIMRTLSIDARNLTLTTNGYGNGATSPDGELNLTADSIFWNTSLPNLRNLTNNGAIRTMNLTHFGSGDAPTYTTNITPAIAATATLFETNTNGNVPATNTVTIGTIGTNYTYVFVNTITNTVPNQIKIAATFDGSMSNLIAAINHAAGSGTGYSTNVTTNTLVMAGLLTNHSFTVTARTAGTNGNSIATTSSTTNLTWNGLLSTNLSGGVDAVTNVVTAGGPYDAFVNHGLVTNLEASTFIYANYFENSGSFGNGVLGSFNLQSQNTLLTNGSIIAGAAVSITTGSLVISNHAIQAGGSLTLQVTNLLTDTGVTNGNIWFVGGSSLAGLNLPIKPPVGDLLGTTIFMTSPPPNKQVVNTWAGTDYGASIAGYTDNEAVGRLILDALGTSSSFKFAGTGVSNALYVDELELFDYASYTNRDVNGNLPALAFNTNLVIYYAQAITSDGASVAEKLNHKNNDHLRWVTNYAGYFSSTNIVFPDGTTYPFNAALRQSINIDSDGDGIANLYDLTPFGTINPTNLIFTISFASTPVPAAVLKWQKATLATGYVTNYVFYKTNLMMPNWLTLTNFITPASSAWPPVPVTMTNPVAGPMRFYRVRVDTKQ